MDEFRVEVRRHKRQSRPGTWDEIVLLVNGRPLMDIVRDAEKRFDAERAGEYMCPPPSVVFAPSRHLLGVLSESEWGEDSFDDKVLIGGCTCGVAACWSLGVRIDVSDDVVMWSAFENPAQVARVVGPDAWNWDDVGPFVFDRRRYESELGFDDRQSSKTH